MVRQCDQQLHSVLIKMKFVRHRGARIPNLVGRFAAPVLEKLAEQETEVHGNQEQHEKDRHQETDLKFRRLQGVSGRRGGIKGHAVARRWPG